MFAVLHFGGHDFACGVRAFEDRRTYEEMKADLLARYARFSMADMVRALDDYFPGESFSLPHLFLEERRRVLANVTRAVLERHEETYRRIWEDSRKLVHYLRQADAPIPDALALIGRHVLESEANERLTTTPMNGGIPANVFELVSEARQLGFTLDLSAAKDAMGEAITRSLQAVRDDATRERISQAAVLIGGAMHLGIRFGLWGTQNEFFELWGALPDTRQDLLPLAELLGFALPMKA
jgi:hypothetical protein